MAPHGDARMDYTPAHFYGSLLIELSFAQEGDIFNNLARSPLPSPSNLWLLNRQSSSIEPVFDIPLNSSLAESLAALAHDESSNTDDNLLSLLGTDLGMGGGFDSSSDPVAGLSGWPTTLDHDPSSIAQLPPTSLHDIFSGTTRNINDDWHSMEADWPWLFDTGNANGSGA